uniref:putative Ig domain-containing protein n=1 Tax=Mangrovicella endophytica TaxID=2066697 RepID=UPI0018E42E97
GTLSGTPTAVGTFNFTVTATDANSFTGAQAYSLQVDPKPVTFSPASGALPSAIVGTAYSQTVTAANGTLTSATGLPSGLSFDPSTGLISGTPISAGSANITITATDAGNAPATVNYTLTVNAAPVVLSPTPGALPNAAVGVAYDQSITITNGTATQLTSYGNPPYWGLTAELSANVVRVHGTPLQKGPFPYPLAFKVKDGNNVETTVQYSITIDAAQPVVFSPAAGALANATVGSAYSQTITVTGGTIVSTGLLPDGLTMDFSTGTISGTPTTVESRSFNVNVMDGASHIVSAQYSIAVDAQPVTFSPVAGSLPNATVGSAYSQTITVTGGTIVSTGALPAGLTMDFSTGTISGTPTSVESRSFNVNVQDGGGQIVSAQYSLTVEAALPVFTNVTPSSGPVAGGNLVVINGANLSSVIEVSFVGYPAEILQRTDTAITVKVPPSSQGQSAWVQLISPYNNPVIYDAYKYVAPPAIFTPAAGALPDATLGQPYSQTITVTGGIVLGYTNLPAGLSMDTTTGILSGTPMVIGTTSFDLQVQDNNNEVVSATYSITVKAKPAIVSPAAGRLSDAK